MHGQVVPEWLNGVYATHNNANSKDQTLKPEFDWQRMSVICITHII